MPIPSFLLSRHHCFRHIPKLIHHFKKAEQSLVQLEKKRNGEEDEVNEWVLLVYFSYVLVRNERKMLKKVSKELVTGISTQPVMLIHDGSVLYFYHHFKLNQDNIT